MNAHADMLIVVSTQRIKHTNGHLSLSCFGCKKFSGFRNAKTSANKRLYKYVCKLIAQIATAKLQYFL